MRDNIISLKVEGQFNNVVLRITNPPAGHWENIAEVYGMAGNIAARVPKALDKRIALQSALVIDIDRSEIRFETQSGQPGFADTICKWLRETFPLTTWKEVK